MNWLAKLLHFPEGYSEVLYKGKKYSLIRRNIKGQQSIKFYAQELGGNDFISGNLYIKGERHWLMPCEMPESKIVNFVENCIPLNP